MIRNKHTVALQAGLLGLIGFSLVAQSIVRFINSHVRHAHLIELNIFSIPPSILLTLIGLILLYLVPYIYKRREIAFILTIALSVSAIVVGLLQRHQPMILLTLLAWSTIWLLFSRRLYKVKSDQVRLLFGVRIALIIAAISLIYGCLGFLILGPSGFHQQFNLYDAMVMSIRAILTLQDIPVLTTQSELFTHSLDVIGGLIYVLIVTSLFKPVRFALSYNKHDALVARDILHHTSTSSEDYFKLWPQDKHYYFSPSRHSFLAYKTSGQTAIILGDPSGDALEFTHLVKSFYSFVTNNGWRLAVINGTETSEALYDKKGFGKLFIGNEAVITTAEYIGRTVRSKHFRYVYNKAEREGLTVEHWKDLDDDHMRILKSISDAWLLRKGHKEYTFFMGYFDPDYLRAGSVMVLKQHDRVIAYMTVLKSFVDNAASIDQLRALPGAPSVAMHFLLGRTIEFLHDQGKMTLNIGLAPLSGISDQDGHPFLANELLKIIKRLGRRYYSFQGVEQFKNKSQPVWHQRYLYYTGGLVALPRTVRDIEQACRPFSERMQRQRVIVGIIILMIVLVMIQFL